MKILPLDMAGGVWYNGSMIDLSRLRNEYAVLAHIVCSAANARDIMRRAAVDAQMFTDQKCREAFSALMDSTAEDDATLLGVAVRHIPDLKPQESIDAFIGLAANPLAAENEAYTLVEAAIKREHSEQMRALLSQASPADPELVFERSSQITAAANARLEQLKSAISMPNESDSKSAQPLYATDESLLHMPGLVDEITEQSLKHAQRPNRVLSFSSVLAMFAHLAGRRYVGPTRARPNIYVMSLAESGMGKEAPRQFNRTIAQQLHIINSVIETVASGQGLEDALSRTPSLLLMSDEFDGQLRVLKDERKSNAATEALWRALLSVFSSSSSSYTTGIKAASANGGGGGKVLYAPSFSMLASATPDNFYGALSVRALEGGLFARCLVFEAGSRGAQNYEVNSCEELPDPLLRKLQRIISNGPRFDENREIRSSDLVNVPYAPGAKEEATRIGTEADTLYNQAAKDGDAMGKSVWSRSMEMVQKLALLYAISEGCAMFTDAAVSVDGLRWAWRLVRAMQERMLEMAQDHAAENPMDERVKRVERLVKAAGKRGIKRYDVSRKTRLSARELDEVEQTLIDRNEIIVQELQPGRNGKPIKRYIWSRVK